jgi:hypothetical protein
MLTSRLVSSVLLPALLSRGLLAVALPAQRATPDPCTKIAGLDFVDPADAIACQKSFKFDERLRKNVMSVVSRVFDFFTFEDFYLNSPPPFQESTKDIRAEIARISSTQYAVRVFSTRTTTTPLIDCRARPTMISTWTYMTSQTN